MRAVVGLLCVALAGCATPAAIQTGPNQWLATISSLYPSKAMAAALRGAGEHCSARGQAVEVMSRQTIPPALLGGYRGHTAEVTFTCVPQNANTATK